MHLGLQSALVCVLWPRQIMMSPTYGRRSLEEELREPTLTCIPGAVATSLEKQVAMAIGLRGDNTMVPRLPRSACVKDLLVWLALNHKPYCDYMFLLMNQLHRITCISQV